MTPAAASVSVPGLATLARAYGVQPWYVDGSGRRRYATPESILATLRVLGAPVWSAADVPDALRECEARRVARGIEPVLVAWDGELPAFELLGVPDGQRLSIRVALEGGGERAVRFRASPLDGGPGPADASADAAERARLRVEPRSAGLPHGYHRLIVEWKQRRFESLVIAAPRQAYVPDPSDGADWGVFLPLYALQGPRSWGAGDLSDLAALAEWAHGLGGRVVGTLPLLAAFLDYPFEPSPYSPASRLFWNELYVDPSRAPELERCEAAREWIGSDAVQERIAALRGARHVDYRELAAIRRPLLRQLARCFFEGGGHETGAFRRFAGEQPLLETYARFMAACETRREAWTVWPERMRAGTLETGDYDEEARRYHIYAQWLVHQQLESLAAGLRARGQRLYLDLPLGVHPDGFDVWHRSELFGSGASVGAPPDAFFSLGQDWGFPPLRPDALRETGFAYVIEALRTHLRYAGMLRIDHVMALHRLYWVPAGADARDGVYVRYPAEELYAVACLESRRHRAILVGEDLGTVPRQVRRAMARHRLQRLWVLQFEMSPEAEPPVAPVPAQAVASVNTHDMPTFAAFWGGLDIDDRVALGLLDEAGAEAERGRRERLKLAVLGLLRAEGWLHPEAPDSPLDVLGACLARMAASAGRAVLVNLEDLWGETEPQNVPGTSAERRNWTRKARLSFDEFSTSAPVLDALRRIDRLRRERRRGRGRAAERDTLGRGTQ